MGRLSRISGTVAVAGLVGALSSLSPAYAATHRHHRDHFRRDNALVVHRLQPQPQPVALFAPLLPIPGQNGVTTDTEIFPDLAVGDGFGGYQTPGLGAYGLQGGGLWGTAALQ